MGTGSFPWIEWSGRGVDHPLPTSAEVKERAQQYLYSPLWAFLVCSRVNYTTVWIPIHQKIIINLYLVLVLSHISYVRVKLGCITVRFSVLQGHSHHTPSIITAHMQATIFDTRSEWHTPALSIYVNVLPSRCRWSFCSSEMRRRVTGSSVPDVSRQLWYGILNVHKPVKLKHQDCCVIQISVRTTTELF